MINVGIREFLRDIGKYKSMVKEGETVLVTNHGSPLFKVVGATDSNGQDGMVLSDLEKRVSKLEKIVQKAVSQTY